MKLKTFLWFTAPSVFLMVSLIMLPLLGTAWLSVHEKLVQTKLVEIVVETPLLGGIVHKETKVVPQAVVDDNGKPVTTNEFIGDEQYTNLIRPDKLVTALTKNRSGDTLRGIYRDISNIEFWNALEFTLLYIATTTPAILILGLVTALAVNRMFKRLKGVVIFTSLLPMIVTPIVGSLAVYWLFLDNAIVTSALQVLGLGKFYFLASAASTRTLIILFGIWHATPFAFVILYAGLQTIPDDVVQAAMVDGASKWQVTRHIVIPHLGPLLVFIALIHLMDAYRVFEPILVFGSNIYANSMQYLTYFIINEEANFNKAAAAGILTIVGILVILTPVLMRTWRAHRRGEV